jgi:ligand-binding SRPBCC domain-containing protein
MGTRLHRLLRSQTIPRPREEVFAFFADAANLERLTPAFLNFRILTPQPIGMAVGTRIDYSLRLFGVPLKWRTKITDWQPGVSFVDEQETGPYALWRHTHRFETVDGQTRIHDLVEYAEPFGPLGRIANTLVVKRTLDRIFDYRREATARIFGSEN